MTQENIFKNGFYYIEEADTPDLFTLTLMTSDYGPEHNPWFLSTVLYEVRNDYEVFCKVAWLDSSSIQDVFRAIRPDAEKISYCITNGTINVPADLFKNPKRAIEGFEGFKVCEEDHLYDIEELFLKIEDDNGVPGSSINDQLYNFTRTSEWGPVVDLLL